MLEPDGTTIRPTVLRRIGDADTPEVTDATGTPSSRGCPR